MIRTMIPVKLVCVLIATKIECLMDIFCFYLMAFLHFLKCAWVKTNLLKQSALSCLLARPSPIASSFQAVKADWTRTSFFVCSAKSAKLYNRNFTVHQCKGTSQSKQLIAQFLAPFSDTVFHALLKVCSILFLTTSLLDNAIKEITVNSLKAYGPWWSNAGPDWGKFLTPYLTHMAFLF